MNSSDPLVSIVMPVFNCGQFLEESIGSVMEQTYTNWELIVVDDNSSDDSLRIAKRLVDGVRQNVIILENETNLGASESRNKALAHSSGRFIAYLDADDVWLSDKLRQQIDYMLSSGIAMCFTSYETIEEDGRHRNFVHIPKSMTYNDFLKNTITCSHTIVFDLNRVELALLMGNKPQAYDYPEDLATWLRVLRTGVTAHGLDVVLAKNRKRIRSRSANKFRAVRRTWNQYTKGEGMDVPHAAYCLFWQVFHAILKRI